MCIRDRREKQVYENGDRWPRSTRAFAFLCIGYKNIPVSIDDAPKAVQGERNVVTTISARSAQRI